MPVASSLLTHYTSISDTMLFEITYDAKTVPIQGTNSSAFLKIQNGVNNLAYQIGYSESNPNGPFTITKNDLSRTAVQISSDVWLQLNDYTNFETFSNSFGTLAFTPTFQNNPSNYLIKYDRIRIYFISGYRFTNIAGLICEVAFTRRDGTVTTIPASQSFIGSNNPFELLDRPFILEQRTYDKYVEFYIPSLQEMTVTPENVPDSFIFTDPKYTELAKNANIDSAYLAPRILVSLYQISKVTRSFGNQIYLYGSPLLLDNNSNILKFDIPKVDSEVFLAASISESDNGDYFEYSGTYNGDYLSEYIDLQNRKGKLMQVIHELDVVEHLNSQAGYQGEFISASYSHVEDKYFDRPFKFRPIITDGLSVAASIDYRLRVIDRLNNTSIIRYASTTIRNPAKYGPKLTKLSINADGAPRIINRIADSTVTEGTNINSLRESILTPALYNANFIETNTSSRVSTIPFVPINIQNISVSLNSLILGALPNGGNLSDTLTNSLRTISMGQIDPNSFTNNTVIYKQGTGILNLNSVNNYVKFNIYETENSTSPSLVTSIIDDGTLRINLMFIDNSGNPVRVSSLNSSGNTSNTKPGEVYFNISKSTVSKLNEFTNRNFYIVINSNDSVSNSSEIMIYSGVYAIELSIVQLKALEQAIKSSILDEKITNINLLRTDLAKISTDLLSILERTSLSADPNIQANQIKDLTAYQQRMSEILLSSALAAEINVDQSTLIQKFQDAFVKATTPVKK
jgi:hypothetical protein